MVNNTGTTHLPSSVRSFQFPGLALSLSSSVPLSPTFSPLGLIRIPRHADLTFPPACVPLARHPEPPTVASLFLSLPLSLSLSLSPFSFRSTTAAYLYHGSRDRWIRPPEGIVIESPWTGTEGRVSRFRLAWPFQIHSTSVGLRLPRNDERGTMVMRLRFFVARSLRRSPRYFEPWEPIAWSTSLFTDRTR